MEINGYKIEPQANLWEANLQGANLWEADLRGANLCRVNLRRTNLRGVDLRGASLWETNLQEVDLRGANLYGADLQGANLQGANLQGVDLYRVNLWGAKIDTELTNIKRDEGELNALKRLKEITTKEQYDSYYRYGYINEGNTTFKINELTYTPQGTFCLAIKTNKYLPRADRIIHRLLLYRHDKDKFFELAKRVLW